MRGTDELANIVLPRELTALADAVRVVAAPPTPAVDEPFALRPADADRDADLVSEWMNRPHLANAWQYDWPLSRWRRYLQAQLDGQYSRPFILSHHGTDVAYIELYRAAKDSIATLYGAEPHDIGIHAAIGELEFVNRGMAQLLLPCLVTGIFSLEPGCRRIMFDPDHRNAGARRVCELAGCIFLGEQDLANRRITLYALPRRPGDQ